MKTYILLVFVALSALVNSDRSNRVLGVWLTEDQCYKIKISRTGTDYSGRIVWVHSDMPDTDIYNSNENLRHRSLFDIELLDQLTYNTDDDIWCDGHIYIPSLGEWYSCMAWLETEKTLVVKAYIGWSVFGSSQKLQRVE